MRKRASAAAASSLLATRATGELPDDGRPMAVGSASASSGDDARCFWKVERTSPLHEPAVLEIGTCERSVIARLLPSTKVSPKLDDDAERLRVAAAIGYDQAGGGTGLWGR